MSPRALDFEGLSVIVTGASAGLGRQYALDFGVRGAHVVVHGRSDNTHAVAETIRTLGGAAVAVLGDVEQGELMFRAAMDACGRVDALVLNAGLVRDKSFSRMNDEEWSEVLRVHLGGARACLSHVFPHMQERRSGRIVITSSGAGLHGRFGQSNYATAKAGLIGLTRSLAIEGARRGVAVNAIAPWAITGMTAGVLTGTLEEALRPERVSPFVLALCHPSCLETGAVIEVGGGWAAKLRWERAAGLHLKDEDLSPERVLERWDDIVGFESGATHPDTTDDSLPYFCS